MGGGGIPPAPMVFRKLLNFGYRYHFHTMQLLVSTLLTHFCQFWWLRLIKKLRYGYDGQKYPMTNTVFFASFLLNLYLLDFRQISTRDAARWERYRHRIDKGTQTVIQNLKKIQPTCPHHFLDKKRMIKSCFLLWCI